MSLPASVDYGGRRVLLKYHKLRSGALRHPPNSLSALEEVLAGGATALEFDAGLLADGNYALLHDDRLERETSGFGPLRRAAATDLARLRLRDADETPATLTEVTARLSRHQGHLKVQVDLKEAEPLSTAAASSLLDALAPLLAATNLRVVVGCLADWNLRFLRRLAPDLPLGFDPAFHLHAPTPGMRMPLPTRVNAYGYADDHPLGFRRLMPIARYLEDRLDSLMQQVPGTVEVYLHKGFVTRALADGFDPIAFVHQHHPGILVDVWTLNDGDDNLQQDLPAALGAGADQLTTDTALRLAPRIEALAAAA
ncbi:MAG TPA: glycerophosphodiester phosphodiesterase family protein [Trueperaceae bacterium]